MKILITLIWIYISFIALKSVWLDKTYISFLDRWVKNKIENHLPVPATSKIIISPKQVILKSGDWKGRSSFNIHNNTGDVCYDIYFKLEIENAGLNSQDIDVTPVSDTETISGSAGDAQINFDTVKLFGTDSQNKECIFLIIYSLAQGENKSYRINIKNTATSNSQQTRISIKFIKYSTQPAQVLEQGSNKVAFSFTLQEKVTIKATSFLIKRK